MWVPSCSNTFVDPLQLTYIGLIDIYKSWNINIQNTDSPFYLLSKIVAHKMFTIKNGDVRVNDIILNVIESAVFDIDESQYL